MGLAEDIVAFESKVARLKLEYEQYFMRVLRREPANLRAELDRLVLSYTGMNTTNSMLKFRLNSAISKYNTYRQYWNRTLREIEEGRYSRRGEGGAIMSAPNGAVRPPLPDGANAPTASAVDINEAYKNYIAAKRQCNEPTDGITAESFTKSIEAARKKMETLYNTNEIDLKVSIKDGKAKISILPKK
ncbi:MAG: MXAN_5187 C-terminal domain-containing protein [Deltaproteobacteria bacterium]